jgi:L-gulonolactone oxidase
VSGSPRTWSNWAGNVRAEPVAIEAPADEETLAKLVAEATARGRRVKVVGSGHSCSPIASSDGAVLVRLDRMARVTSVDRAQRRVVAEAGITLEALNTALAEHGLALPNQSVIASQSIAGAIATGTHGTGLAFGGLAEFVTSVRAVTANGDSIEVEGDADGLDAFRTSLGALGVVTRVTLACDDAFDLSCCDEPADLDDALRNLDRLNDGGTFGFWWFPHVDRVVLRTWTRVPSAARATSFVRSLSSDVIGNHMNEVLRLASARGLVGAAAANRLWFLAGFARRRDSVDRSDRALTSTIRVRQRVLEYAVPYERTREAIEAIRALVRDGGHSAQAPIDVRFGRAERAWLGLAHDRATCWIGLVAYRPFGRETEWEPFFRRADALLRELGGRPHWGKIHFQDAASLRPLYSRFDDFRALRAQLDPRGTFVNDYLQRVLGVP